MKPNLYITRTLPDEVLSEISADFRVKMWESADESVPYEVLEKEIVDADAVLCLLTDRIDAALLGKAKQLKVVSTMAVGYNNIDIEACTGKGIVVTNTPDVLTETTADLTFALLLATARRLVESSQFLKDGKWKTWSPMLLTGQDVYGATLGVIGMGRIGEAVARRAKGFNMKVLYYNRTKKIKAEQEYGVQYRELDSMLKESDFVVIMIPYSPQTKNLIAARELSLMKPTAILVNTARGGIVNEDDLYAALNNKQIWAAGLDVFDHEPVSPNHPLAQMDNVVALPHIGSASIATRIGMGKLAVRNLIAVLQGQKPSHRVN
jgi:glyoxylate reductase